MEKGGVLNLAQVSAGAQPFLVTLLRCQFPHRPIVVVLEGLKGQEIFQQDLETWFATIFAVGRGMHGQTGRELPLFYPAWEIFPHESKLPHADVISERMETLLAMNQFQNQGERPSGINHRAPTVVTSIVACLQRTLSPVFIQQHSRWVRKGDAFPLAELVEWLEAQGYEPEAQVTQKGEMALRGGILDVFPLTQPWPVRLEFFGDELESLRSFDPITQLSQESMEKVALPPAGEIGLIKRYLAAQQSQAHTATDSPIGSILDHIPPDSIWVWCNPGQWQEVVDHYMEQLPAGDPFHLRWAELESGWQATAHQWAFLQLEEGELEAPSWDSNSTEWKEPAFTSLEVYRPLGRHLPDPQIGEIQRREFFDQIHRWQRQGYAIHLFCNNDGERQRFKEIWQEMGYHRPVPDSVLPAAKEPSGSNQVVPFPVHLGALSQGFLLEEGKLVVVTDAEIFGRYKVHRPRRLKTPHAQAMRSSLDIDFSDLEEGDYVVHLQHGIGRFLGLKVLPPMGRSASMSDSSLGQESLVIEYAPSSPDHDPPKLYVPVTESHLVSKYVGAGKARPVLHTLGGTRWAKAKAQAEKAVQDLAGELLAIQAARESLPGHPCRPDTPWQREFESAFLYEETRDQIKAIQETKTDMEKARPMDRLICGDVGFGKTEVAIRAAFKAIMDGKQVALLVPTTVLAQQHFNSFRERMADYPVRVELLSRFRSRGQQQQTLAELAAGAVDIVIGTHRLVQKDVQFKDLGLVIVDEEQRFGVRHKEQLKRLRQMVDVLTLSATPIPRTLYLSLTGARDMSTIETPPQDRLPVQTIVMQYDERTIRDAIQRELNRGGQVFFLHNRVTTIHTIAEKLKALVPHARLVVGHGQMHSDELEEVMTQFVNGEADILLSTTIIESGVDIPNANTIIIDRADRFGLSDLYQLRGRVGRYKHQAYAYLLLPRHASLLSDVRKRITAIKQYSSLGSGFKIAMRDLEIRGAGNLLGPQQSGHITAIGFDLYCQLLKQSIAAFKGEKVKPRMDVVVRLDFLAMNPGQEQTNKRPSRKRKPSLADPIQVPREVAAYTAHPDEETVAEQEPEKGPPAVAPAYIPLAYAPDTKQRIEIYRKLAQVTEVLDLQNIRNELRDRFGPLPPPVDRLMQVAEVKLAASQRGIHVVETKGDKLMLTRNKDYVMVAGRFPRLIKKDPKARLNEIRRLIETF